MEDQLIPNADQSTPLEPTEVRETTLHADLTKAPVTGGFEPFAGEYHLVELDKDGNEVPGSDFSIGKHTFYQVFQPLIGKTFQLKKKLIK